MNTAYSYDNIVLTPKYSEIQSRSKLDTSVEFLGKKFESVAIPANMKCTIDFRKARELSQFGYFYVLHRFYDYDDIYDWVKDNQDLKTISISVGVNEKDYELVNDLFVNKLRVDYITIDVAHGHHILVKRMIEHIKNHNFKNSAKVIAGNIGTTYAAMDLKSWGADAVKVGLSMGKSCTTYNCTGVGTPMFSTVANLSYLNIPVIADGQIRPVSSFFSGSVSFIHHGHSFVCLNVHRSHESLFLMYRLFLILYNAFFNNLRAFSVFLGPLVTLKNSTLFFFAVLFSSAKWVSILFGSISIFFERKCL